ncbi:hypothetical protein ACOMHN_056490 [Nucella lapillus]
MASVEPSDSSDRLSCCVCHQNFIDPKILPCGHLLCRHCLLSWMQANKDAGCPLCRSHVVEGEGRGTKSLEDVADGLPTDLSMVRLVEAERLLNKQHQCCACEEVVATCLCLDCRDMMCKSCAKMHKKFPMAKDHVTEDLCKLTPEKLAVDPRSPTCTYHTKEVCSLYCPAHDESMCHTCAMTRHRNCQEVEELEEKITDARAVLAELVARLNEGQSAISQGIQQLDDYLQESEKRAQALIQKIDTICDQLDAAIRECRRHLKELVHKSSSELKEAVHDGKTHLLQRKGKVTCHKIVAERVQEMKAQRDVETMTGVVKARVDDMDLSTTLPANAKVVPNVTLEISMEAVSSCEKMLKELGKVECSPADLKAQPEGMLAEGGAVRGSPAAVMTDAWSFHVNHGEKIVLSNDNKTADIGAGISGGGLVMASEEMKVEKLYQVEISKVNSFFFGLCGALGVTVQAPHTITLPDTHLSSHPAFIMIGPSVVMNQGTETLSTLGAALKDLHAGSRVGGVLDRQRSLHLYVDGTDRAVFASDVPQPCFFTINLFKWEKVTTLPLQPVV